MIPHTSFLAALVAAASWGTGHGIAVLLTQDSPSSQAYAVITGWWLTAYESAKFSLPVRAAVPLAIGYLAVYVVLAAIGSNFLYRDTADAPLYFLMPIGAAQALIFCSPPLFDHAVSALQRLFGAPASRAQDLPEARD